jgi:cytoskeleton protein RodZ
MNFEELGQALKEERERKGLTVSAVMEATKISRTSIEALEAGNRSNLPHPVYAKGFVKSYARFLGLDADELSMVVDREYKDESCGPREHGYDVAPHAEKAFHANDCAAAESRRSRLVLVVALIFLVAVVGLLVFSFSASDKSASLDQGETVRSGMGGTQPGPPAADSDMAADEAGSQAAPGEPTADSPGVQEQSSEMGQGETGQSEAGALPTAGEPPQSAISDQDTVGQGATGPAAAKPEAPDRKPATAEPVKPVARTGQQEETFAATDSEAGKQKFDHVLIIRATTEKGCWIGLWQGEETAMARDFVLRQGEPLRLMFNNPRRIRIGNVAGVTVTYNGKPYPLDNARGNIQTLRFGTE